MGSLWVLFWSGSVRAKKKSLFCLGTSHFLLLAAI